MSLFSKKKEPYKIRICDICQSEYDIFEAFKNFWRTEWSSKLGGNEIIHYCSFKCSYEAIESHVLYQNKVLNCTQCDNEVIFKKAVYDDGNYFCSDGCSNTYSEKHNPYRNYQAWKD